MKQQQLADGVVMSFLSDSQGLTVSRIDFEAGASASLHAHAHEEVNFALDGRFEVELAGSRYLLTKGTSVRIPPNTQHSIRNLAGEASLLCIWPAAMNAIDMPARSRAKA